MSNETKKVLKQSLDTENQDTHDEKRRKIANSPLLGALNDIEEMIAVGGISHGDVKGDNFILHAQDWKELCSGTKTDVESKEGWFIFDFGEAVFRSDCSLSHWKEQCNIDLINASGMFAATRAQLAITSLKQWLYSFSDVDPPAHFNQEQLIPILRAAAALPTEASCLIGTLSRRISSPSFTLIDINVLDEERRELGDKRKDDGDDGGVADQNEAEDKLGGGDVGEKFNDSAGAKEDVKRILQDWERTLHGLESVAEARRCLGLK
ncbi:hypothetical protein DL98DRAFT_586910 [Cadophora sp. DSE1049]|nr:hypothetical protein DL98DRAFT_586910 [Cadophora sp. DSE1049]